MSCTEYSHFFKWWVGTSHSPSFLFTRQSNVRLLTWIAINTSVWVYWNCLKNDIRLFNFLLKWHRLVKEGKTGSQPQQNRFNFERTTRMKFQVWEFLSATLANFLKLMAKSRNTSPEMIILATLSTTAAWVGTKAGLQLKPINDYVKSGNIFTIGK